MGNKHRGETEIEAEGKTYTLRLSIDAICQLEEAAGRGFSVIAGELSNPEQMRVGTARALLWAALREHHPEITMEQAGDLMVAAGGVMVVLVKLSEAVTLAFPPAAEANGATPRPTKATKAAPVGIGRAS